MTTFRFSMIILQLQVKEWKMHKQIQTTILYFTFNDVI